MRKVYLITSGDYSDYGVDAVYSTQKLAREALKSFSRQTCIEEYDLNTPIDEAYRKNKNGWFVYFEDITVADVTECNVMGSDGFKEIYQITGRCGEKLTLRVYILADTEKRAIKVANEKRASILASVDLTNNDNLYKYWEV